MCIIAGSARGTRTPVADTYRLWRTSAVYFRATRVWSGVGRAAYHFVAADARGATRSEAFWIVVLCRLPFRFRLRAAELYLGPPSSAFSTTLPSFSTPIYDILP
jgi:hypothetical protein